MAQERDAVVVGAGPNGLAAAIVLARAGRAVRVLEAASTIGGGCRTRELTLPGFHHDTCSAIHPLAAASPFLRTLPLGRHGLEWVEPPVALAHPLDDGSAVLLCRSVDETAAGLGEDAAAYARLVRPLVEHDAALLEAVLRPLLAPLHLVALARFGTRAAQPASVLARRLFRRERARALFAGLAAHSALPLSSPGSSAFGLVLALLGHTTGWPLPAGGAGRLAEALGGHLLSLGGELETGRRIESLAELGTSRPALLDVTPRQLLALGGEQLPARYRRGLARFRYGPGAFKIDWALDGPIPWLAPECTLAATVHLGGTLAEIDRSERAAWRDEHVERPFAILTQPSLFDASRAPAGKHTAWAYCHVPNGSGADMTARLEAQVERFAPGFRELILARSARGPAELEASNPNNVGGDINGGAATLRQLLARPVARLDPYRTPLEGVYLCSASTPPGGGVHGMCGFHAAAAALR